MFDAARHDLSVDASRTLSIDIQISVNGEPMDLTGFTPVMVVVSEPGADPALTFTEGNGFEVTDAVNGWIRLVVQPAQIPNSIAGRHLQELTIQDPSSGVNYQPWFGDFVIYRSLS